MGLSSARFRVPKLLMAVPVVALVLALAAGSALATDFNIYCSPTNAAGGDGSLGNPYPALASINWSVVSSQITAGNNVNINLLRGTIFREKWNFPAGFSGSPTARIVVKAYGSGPNPIIAGDDLVTGFTRFTAGAGSTWTATVSGPPAFTFVDGNKLDQGPGTNSLANKQWLTSGNTLFLRWDNGNPDLLGRVVEASVRDTCAYLSASSNIDIVNIDMRRGGFYGLRLRTGANVSLTGSHLLQGNLLLDLDTFTNFSAKSCQVIDGWFGNAGVQVEGPGTSFAFWFCSFEHFPLTTDGTININSGPGGSFVNCSFANTKGYHLYNSSPNANIWFANCVLSGTGTGLADGGYAVRSVAGTCNLTNCLVMSHGKNPWNRLSGANEYSTVWTEPQFQQVRYPAILSFCLDDSAHLDDFVHLANVMKTNYGWRASFAYDRTPYIAAVGSTNKLHALLADGHEIICHSRWHSTLTEPRAFTLQYTGTGKNATLTIANSNLFTSVNGTNDLSISFTNPLYATAGRLSAYISSRPGYSCIPFPVANPNLPCGLLTNVTAADIHTVPYTNFLNYTNLLYNEILLSKGDLESSIGNGYVSKAFNYPSGNNDQNIDQIVTNTGYLSARGVNNPPYDGYQLSGMNIFRLAIAPDTKGIAMILTCQSNALDITSAQNNFVEHNITYDTSHPYGLCFDAAFDGVSSYLYRPSNGYFDFSQGDWLYACHLWPNLQAGTNTLFFEGTDSSNYLKVFIDPAGSVWVDAKTNGASVVSFSTGPAVLTNGGWQEVCVQEVLNTWTIRVNYNVVAVTNSSARLPNFGGTVYIGCSYDGAATQNYYSGYLADMVAAAHTYSRTMSMLDQMCEEGCFYVYYGHGEATAPFELWRTILDAVRDYSGGVMVMPQSDGVNYIRTNGLFLSDGMTVVRTNPLVANNNYNLRSTSPMRMAGLASLLFGQTNLLDLNGLQITGPNGDLLRGGVSLGAREYQPPPALPVQPNQTLAGLTSLQVTNTQIDPGVPANGVTYTLLVAPLNATITSNGVILWTPLPSQVPSTNLFTTVATYYSSNGQVLSATNSFIVTVNAIHNGPTLAPIADQTVYADSVLTVSNSVSDTDIPPRMLTFQLDPGAPVTATINATNGVFIWPTSDADANTTSRITVRVTDDGSPSLGDAKTFTATVLARPSLGALVLSNNVVLLTWSALPGRTYRVQYKATLDSTAWTNLLPDVTASSPAASLTDPINPNSQRFYRILVLP